MISNSFERLRYNGAGAGAFLAAPAPAPTGSKSGGSGSATLLVCMKDFKHDRNNPLNIQFL